MRSLKIREKTEWNFSYYPIIFKDETTLLSIRKKLNEIGVYPRRYFYPSLNKIEYVKGPKMLISDSIAQRILCLPLYYGLEINDQERIIDIINSNA